MSDHIDVSVIIGFKDWGLERLALAVKSISGALGDVKGEIIVSDYGSDEETGRLAKEAVEELGARYVYTQTDGVWSRSRALNAGFAESRGAVLICTDADMIFTPRSLEIVTRKVLVEPSLAVVLQCRDLPERFAAPAITAEGFAWEEYMSESRLRPRWGMGGMIAASRSSFLTVRGLDERMEIYGGEDIDYANRLRRIGCRVLWIEHPDVRMYHVWHPPSRQLAVTTDEGRAAIERNKQIFLGDESPLRNFKEWSHRPKDAAPPVSVVISTHNRAEYLAESVNSVLGQTVQDFELIIVDDGSTDSTYDVVQSLSDPRIRYFRRPQAGIAAARNFAADHSIGRYTVVHDDDDIMLPWRLEAHLSTLTGSIHGSYGGWVDFDTESGELYPQDGKTLNLGSILYNSKVYLHPTLMVATEMLRAIRYNESLRSGSDYNLGARMLRSGAAFKHTGEFHTLRRLHPAQITATDGTFQRSSAVLTSFVARTVMSTAGEESLRKEQRKAAPVSVRGREDTTRLVTPFLPDHLVRRTATVPVEKAASRSDVKAAVFSAAQRRVTVASPEGLVLRELAVFEDVDWAQMATLRKAGLQADLVADARHEGEIEDRQGRRSAFSSIAGPMIAEVLERNFAQDSMVLVIVGTNRITESHNFPEPARVRMIERTFADGHEQVQLACTTTSSPAELFQILQSVQGHPSILEAYIHSPGSETFENARAALRPRAAGGTA